jgi:hypothetical protein
MVSANMPIIIVCKESSRKENHAYKNIYGNQIRGMVALSLHL